MGSRGASSSIAKNGKKYGTEYRTVLQSGNIKFVKYNDASEAKAPMETMTRNRVYVTVNDANQLVYITYMSGKNLRVKNIDLLHAHKGMIPHVHHGYFHNENDGHKGGTRLNAQEKLMVENVRRIWDNHNRKS